MTVTRVYATTDGESHFEDVEVPLRGLHVKLDLMPVLQRSNGIDSTMRSFDAARLFLIATAALLVLLGCSSSDCLPEPQQDATPPQLQVTAYYTAPGARTETSRTVTNFDSTIVVAASRTEPVRVEFVARDSSGLRQLTPGVTVQQTVGLGVERQLAPVNSVQSSCPVATMQTRYEAHTSGKPRVLIVSAVAENWAGSRSTIEPLSIRMQ